MSDKPGVMIYFDMRQTLSRLSDRQAGILFRAILEYGATKKVPELPDSLYLLWPLLQMRLDNDDQRYHSISQKRQYATYKRWNKDDCKTFEQWLLDNCDEAEAL